MILSLSVEDLASLLFVKTSKVIVLSYSIFFNALTGFNEEYIAIKNQQPLEHDKDLDRLRERLGQRHIDSSQLLIEYIRDKGNEIH
jgi:hypothetical protein